MSKKKRIPTSGELAAWNNPFAALLAPAGIVPVDAAPQPQSPTPAPAPASKKSRGRVDIVRQTAHRGGKTVIVVKGFTGVSPVEMKSLAKEMQSACGAGGTMKDGHIEIQGDHREIVAQILTNAGFRPVFAGG